MKKILAIAVICVLALSTFAMTAAAYDLGMDELAEYGQKTFNMYKHGTTPTIDGAVNAAEYGDAIAVFTMETENVSTSISHGSYYGSGAPTAAFPTAINCYATYDSEYLYFAVVVNDPDHYYVTDWQGDFLEFRLLTAEADFSSFTNNNRENAAKIYKLGLKSNATETYTQDGTFADKKVVRDETAKTTTYEYKIALSADTVPGYTANTTKILCSFGVIFGDSTYSTSSTYYGPAWTNPGASQDVGYLRTYNETNENITGTWLVFNVVNLAGDAPVEDDNSNPGTNPGTSDFGVSAVLLLAGAAVAVVACKSKKR